MFQFFLHFLFPPKCLICKKKITEYNALCEECWNNIKIITKPYCQKCGTPLEFEIADNELCVNCIKNDAKYIKIRTAYFYDNKISKVVTRFKFYDDTYLKHFIAKSMVKAGEDIIPLIDAFLPIPLHKKRLRVRKYNQSLLLAKEIAKMTNKVCIDDLLLKKEHTIPQAKLKQKERMQNLKNKFFVNEKYSEQNDLKKLNFCLIDDVMTTGTTLNECIKALNKFGIKNVYALTFTRTNFVR